MVDVSRSALVTYSTEQMYALVNDFNRYPEFMPGCVGAELLAQGDGWLEARLDIAKAGVKQSFTTHNILVPPTEMKIELVEGPFSQFSGLWQFSPLGEGACKVEFNLSFSFKNRLLGMAVGKVLENVASEQVAAICRRADVIYG